MSDESEHFVPTLHLRWHWVIVGVRFDKVLEQLYQGDKGHQRWIKVPTSHEPAIKVEPELPPDNPTVAPS